MSAHRALAAALLVSLALLSACTADEPAPKMPDPTTSAPTSEPTETEAPEAETPGAETAKEFLRRWQTESDAMQVSGETEAFMELSADNCRACKDYVAAVEEIYSAGGRVKFGGSKILEIGRTAAKPATLELTMDVPKTVIFRSTGPESETMPSGRSRLKVIMDKSKAGWAVTYYGVL